ncbi:50S ribosome-binding GTPase [Verrucomicrobiaceae bacterium N1E253]|uniref:50S ribosome-binding GTPase n=1 Tax=Oceaniferula marina TaxID=2748318 RepID=A0A851GIV6_9BACT|nr:GTPase [Oceaniferula marina]NWK54580.1 50S ribosome-binding GTPase [Oceaniferula marina]
MFGEAYFSARSGLEDLAGRVIELAEKTGTDHRPLSEGDVAVGLDSPFLWLVCGEAGAGKSTLVNALFGRSLCPLDSQRGSKVRWFRYADRPRTNRVTDALEECYLPEEYLSRFNVMDTPGLGPGYEPCQEVVQRFLPSCDHVFWVLPIGNPWGGAFWDLLSSQPDAVLQKSVLLLQRKDECDENELEIILGHVRDLAGQRLATIPPILPVSARQAWQARKDGRRDEAMWAKSGFDAFFSWLQQAVMDSPARKQSLVEIRQALAEVLRRIEVSVEERTEQLQGNEHFLRDLEWEADRERMGHAKEFVGDFADMRRVLASKNNEFQQYLRRKLGFWSSMKSLLFAENTSKVIEGWMIRTVQSAAQQQANEDGERVIEECHRHWSTVRPRVKNRLGIALDDFDDEADGFFSIGESFEQSMADASRKAIQDLRIRKDLHPIIQRRREHLKNWLYLSFSSVMLAGATGALSLGERYYLPYGFLALGGVAMLGFVIQGVFSGRKVKHLLAQRLEHGRVEFSQALESRYSEGIRRFYVEYLDLLSGVRRHILHAQQDLAPNLEERNRLFLELMILEREM